MANKKKKRKHKVARLNTNTNANTNNEVQSRSATPSPAASPSKRGSVIGSGPKGNRSSQNSPRRGSKVKKKKSNGTAMNVIVRVRPLNKAEKLQGWNTLDVSQSQIVTVHDPKDKSKKGDPLSRSRETKYAFDHALEPSATNADVFGCGVERVVNNVMSGHHGTVFAYGATGSGKTFTMSGTEDNPGVMFHTIQSLFSRIAETEHQVTVTASYLEIYNENLIDLLGGSQGASQIELREDRVKGIIVAGVTEYVMESAADVFKIIQRGSRNRTVDSHDLNAASSRSHAVLMIGVNQCEIVRDKVSKSANLTMIDLAGSERAKKAATSKKMLREGAKINRSLLALANCINALCQPNKKGLYIPYRDSKLTRLLKDSLGGGAVTVMIANVSPASSQFDETRETLLYANRAKEIKVTEAMLKQEKKRAAALSKSSEEYEKMISDLTAELTKLKGSMQLNRSLGIPVKSITQGLTTVSEYNDKEDVLIAQSLSSHSGEGLVLPSLQRRDSVLELELTNNLVDDIVSNFQERFQLRRALVEIEEQDTINRRDLAIVKATLDHWEAVKHQHESTLPEIKQARLDKQSLYSSLVQNAVYKKERLQTLKDLDSEFQELLSRCGSISGLRHERQQIVHLTLEKCVLELQKMELELDERATRMESTDREKQMKYYESLLRQNNISFMPFEDARAWYDSNSDALPAVPAPTITKGNTPSKERLRELASNIQQFTSSLQANSADDDEDALLTESPVSEVKEPSGSKRHELLRIQSEKTVPRRLNVPDSGRSSGHHRARSYSQEKRKGISDSHLVGSPLMEFPGLFGSSQVGQYLQFLKNEAMKLPSSERQAIADIEEEIKDNITRISDLDLPTMHLRMHPPPADETKVPAPNLPPKKTSPGRRSSVLSRRSSVKQGSAPPAEDVPAGVSNRRSSLNQDRAPAAEERPSVGRRGSLLSRRRSSVLDDLEPQHVASLDRRSSLLARHLSLKQADGPATVSSYRSKIGSLKRSKSSIERMTRTGSVRRGSLKEMIQEQARRSSMSSALPDGPVRVQPGRPSVWNYANNMHMKGYNPSLNTNDADVSMHEMRRDLSIESDDLHSPLDLFGTLPLPRMPPMKPVAQAKEITERPVVNRRASMPSAQSNGSNGIKPPLERLRSFTTSRKQKDHRQSREQSYSEYQTTRKPAHVTTLSHLEDVLKRVATVASPVQEHELGDLTIEDL